jgi:hypothetical protein
MVAAVRGWRGVVAVAAALVLGSATPTAAAETVGAVQGRLLAGPIPAGPSLVWVEQLGEGPPTVMRADPGADPVVLATLDEPAGMFAPKVESFDAGAARWAMGVFHGMSYQRQRYLVLTGAVAGGPVETLVECDTAAGCACPRVDVQDILVAVSDSTVAYRNPCRAKTVVVHGSGGDQKVPSGKIDSLQLAGNYVGWQTDAGVIPQVYDLAQRRLVVRVSTPRDYSFTIGQSLQADGTVVLPADNDGFSPSKVLVASPASPRGRLIHQPPGGEYLYDAQISGNRIVALQQLPDVNHVVATGDRVMWAGDRTGRHWRLIGRFVGESALAETDDGAPLLRVAEGRVAWATGRCQARLTLDTASIDELVQTPFAPDDTGCRRATVRAQPITLRGRQLRIVVHCPQACDGTLEAGSARGRRGQAHFARASRGNTTVAVRLPAAFVADARDGGARLHVLVVQDARVVYAVHGFLEP